MIAMTITFVMVAVASAGSHHARINGHYAITGSGACLLAFLGFDSTGQPNKPPPGWPPVDPSPVWFIQTYTSEGEYTFYHNGTGSATAQNRLVTLPYTVLMTGGSPTITLPPAAGVQQASFDFQYTVTDGTISITADTDDYFIEYTYGPSTGKSYYLNGFSRTGSIAPDGKTITLNGGVPDIMTFKDVPYMEIMCNGSFVLIRQNK